MQRIERWAALFALAMCAGCSTPGLSIGKKHVPIDPATLQRQADLVLDYTGGNSEALPKDLLHSTPLTNLDDDAVQAMQTLGAAMRNRFPEIAKLKEQRLLGEDNRGYLVLRHDEQLANAAEKNGVQKTMGAENVDRKAFYRAMARANDESGLTLTRVERVFAARRIERSSTGAIVQLPSNDEEFTALRNSPVGKKLGDTCRPGSWVDIP